MFRYVIQYCNETCWNPTVHHRRICNCCNSILPLRALCKMVLCRLVQQAEFLGNSYTSFQMLPSCNKWQTMKHDSENENTSWHNIRDDQGVTSPLSGHWLHRGRICMGITCHNKQHAACSFSCNAHSQRFASQDHGMMGNIQVNLHHHQLCLSLIVRIFAEKLSTDYKVTDNRVRQWELYKEKKDHTQNDRRLKIVRKRNLVIRFCMR